MRKSPRENPRESADGVAGRRSLLAVGEVDDREAGELARRMTRFSTHHTGSILGRSNVLFLSGSPKSGVLLPLRGSSSRVRGDPAASDSEQPARKRLGIAVRAFFWARVPMDRHGLACGLTLTASPVLTEFRAGGFRRGSRRPDRRPRRRSAEPWHRRRGSGGGAPRRPPLRQWGGKLGGLRGASAPPCQPRRDTRSVATAGRLAPVHYGVRFALGREPPGGMGRGSSSSVGPSSGA